ncbi:MAG: PAS domain S-box protein, partial [Merismopedia sp. SIO2A8]|nr:PAS domain S-box protein [Merismopedia sp. SIO2A8]
MNNVPRSLLLDSILNRHPLTLPPQTSVMVAIEHMHQWGQPVLVVERRCVVGIFSKSDVVKAIAQGIDVATVTLSHVMTQPVMTVLDSHLTSGSALLEYLHQHHLKNVPIVDHDGELVGLVTRASLTSLSQGAPPQRSSPQLCRVQEIDPLQPLDEIEQCLVLEDEQLEHVNSIYSQTYPSSQTYSPGVEGQTLSTTLEQTNRELEARIGLQAAQIVHIHQEWEHKNSNCHHVQAQLERFFALTPSLLCIVGLDGFFKQISPSFTHVLGYDPFELLAHPFLRFVHPDDQQATQAEVEHLAMGELTIAFENRYRCKDGHYRWLSWNATASMEERLIYAAAQDITDHKQCEENLRLTTDSLPVLICYVDTDHCYRFNNQTYELWFCRPVAELWGQSIENVMGPIYYRNAQPHIQKALRGEKAMYDATLTTPDGHCRELEITYIPDIDSDKKVKGFWGLINDISDRKATERIKNEFVSVAGHELRTPLTSIYGS